jgi:hypothetical protein
MMAGAVSKAYDFLSDMPLDEAEREAAIETATLTCYQLNLTMLDWRVSCAVFLASTASVRAPAAYKKWKPKLTVPEPNTRAADATYRQEQAKAQPKPVEGVRLTPVPEPTVTFP